ncbi:MAG: hypothetical protein ACOCTQ_02035 [Planctomycetota bacterium]
MSERIRASRDGEYLRNQWRMTEVGCILLLTALTVVLTGCQLLRVTEKPLPPAKPRSEIVASVRRDHHGFRSVVDTSISLRMAARVEGEWEKMPSLGGLIAFDRDRPGLWLRTEKMGQNVFSLRADGDSFWLEIPDTEETVSGTAQAYERLPQLIRPREAMMWFASPEWLGLTWSDTEMTVEGDMYRFDVDIPGQLIRSVYVDRRTERLSGIVEYDTLGRKVTEVIMDQHVEIDKTTFPSRLVVIRHQSGYRIEVRLRDPSFNKDIQPEAFKPRERKGWDHIDLDHEPVSRIRAFSRDN